MTPSSPRAKRDSAIARGGSDDPPPLLGTWRRVYLVVLISQAIVIALLTIFATVTG